ncbi:glucan biosynthesis protein [Marinivivus vitaminiproducens]|uniref:glucan biosynthesis protein n=1 Tax=Marinivivus vitaminiproducens TaxID=3035935 RepID=UPI00279F67BD|nr:glucan biosynthesis protein [Geminicoccaceae bacterium SCSIO 64248]
MTPGTTRRRLLQVAAALGLAPLLGRQASAQESGGSPLSFGEPEAFSWDNLVARAQAMAAQAYAGHDVPNRDALAPIDFDAFWKIRYRPEASLWPDREAPFPAQFFHRSAFNADRVPIFAIEDGQAREVLYDEGLFSYEDEALRDSLPDDLGFAGFNLRRPPPREGDWLVFLGASYFRTDGEQDQFGLSARGLSINTGLSPEEFPRFTTFWLERTPPGSGEAVIYALLDSESACGAYRFVVSKPGPAIMEVDARLFMRKAVERLGIAPLSSMFWFGPQNRHAATDWRPQVHDSDGLALWTGQGEHIWRPLNNPSVATTNSFSDADPKGFGLQQRARDFSDFEDDGVFYERRPSVWIEPLHAWGRGAVQLLELPTDDEIYDNIACYWLPEAPTEPGQALEFRYRLTWSSGEPYPREVARVVATRVGRGGAPGFHRVRSSRKFVIDFADGGMVGLVEGVKPSFDIDASRGKVSEPYVLPVVGTDRWRLVFDLFDIEGDQPIDLRALLTLDGRPITETWVYQYQPFRYADEMEEGPS